MKANHIPSTGTAFASRQNLIHPAALAAAGISAAALLLVCGCATNKPAGVTGGNEQPLPLTVRAGLGSIALVSATEPAAFSFDRAQGQVETAGHLAGVAAGNCLVPTRREPGLEVLESGIRLVAAPVAALGAGRKANQRLAPGQLSECETNLVLAMRRMADQAHFKDALLQAGTRQTGRRFLTAPLPQGDMTDQVLPDTILETRTEQLRLERTGKGDDSFALRIQARTRLLRVADGAVLFDRPSEYLSGTCLFLDWTLDNSLGKAAQTGYRELAERAVNQLLAGTTPDGPIVRGAGYKQTAPRQRQPATTLVESTASPLLPAARLAGFADDNSGAIEIYSADNLPRVALQRPLTRDDAAVEAVRAMEYDFDGLYNHPNIVISLASIAAAVPVGIWRQAVATATGLSQKAHRKADTQLTAAARQAAPQQAVACAVAQLLAPQTSQPVMLARGTFVPSRERNTQLASSRGQSMQPGNFVRQAVSGQEPATALEIKVIRAGLRGGTGANPSLAFCIEATARVLRPQDGTELCSYPVHYRGKAHKFTQWAANDAKLFRVEMEQSCREIGSAIADEMVAQGFAPPAIVSRPVLAGN